MTASGIGFWWHPPRGPPAPVGIASQVSDIMADRPQLSTCHLDRNSPCSCLDPAARTASSFVVYGATRLADATQCNSGLAHLAPISASLNGVG